MTQPLVLGPMAAGLSNQKLALAGLLLRGGAERRPVALAPLHEFGIGAAPPVPFAALFDRAALAAACDALGIALAPGEAGEEVAPDPPFRTATAAIVAAAETGSLPASPVARLLAAMRPAAALERQVAAGAEALARQRITIGCQMRIERDWRAYATGPLARRTEAADDAAPAPERIAARLAATFERPAMAFVTWNEADLPIAADRIAAAIRAAAELVIRTKRDLLPHAPAAGTLTAALLDFELLAGLPTIVGNSLSSFFNLAHLTALARGRRSEAWLANLPGDRLVRRTDRGAFANAIRATAACPAPPARP